MSFAEKDIEKRNYFGELRILIFRMTIIFPIMRMRIGNMVGNTVPQLMYVSPNAAFNWNHPSNPIAVRRYITRRTHERVLAIRKFTFLTSLQTAISKYNRKNGTTWSHPNAVDNPKYTAIKTNNQTVTPICQCVRLLFISICFVYFCLVSFTGRGMGVGFRLYD